MLVTLFQLSRRSLLMGGLATAVLAAGCASIRDPVVGNERVEGAPVSLGNVLVVVDYRADMQANGNNDKNAPALDKLYAPAAQAMSQAVIAAGGKPTVVYVRHTDDLPTATQDYSHVWTQRITSLSRVSQSYATWTQYRVWSATIAHRRSPGNPLSTGYQADYVSDGVMCFTVTQFSNREECQAKYQALLAAQLKKYGSR